MSEKSMTALAVIEPQVAMVRHELGETEIQLIKDTIAKGATDAELALFIKTANRLGLDPFARQIFLVKRWDGQLKREVATPQISIDGFRLVAERTNRYAPGKPTEFQFENGKLISAVAYVRKLSGGTWHETGEIAYYEEYVQTTREGAPNAMWKKMPRVMLAKCAEARALRRAFPAELSGVYTVDEMGQAATGEYVDAEVIPATKGATQSAPPPSVPDSKAVAVANAIVESYRSMLVALNRWGAGEGLEKADTDAETFRVADSGVQAKMAAEAKGNLVKMVEAFVAQIDAENPDAIPVDLAEKVGVRESLKGGELIQLGDALRRVLDRVTSDDVPADSIGF